MSYQEVSEQVLYRGRDKTPFVRKFIGGPQSPCDDLLKMRTGINDFVKVPQKKKQEEK